MSEIAGLVTAEAVLTCAGLTVSDMSIPRLLNSGVGEDLELHLSSAVPNYLTLFSAAAAPGASQQTRNISLALKNYAKWYCAATLAGIPSLYKQLVSDGKTRNDRFDRMDFSAQLANITAKKLEAWTVLQENLTTDPEVVSVVPVFMSKVEPTYNPITDLDA